MTVRVRFAPSPTGFLHVGGARTALFNWLFARHEDGVFLLRIEDTDRARSSGEMTKAILDGLAWLCLTVDEGPVFQADGVERHRADAETLLAHGAAYRCFCTPEELAARREAAKATGEGFGYDGRCRATSADDARRRAAAGEPCALRFRVPAGETAWDDLIHGTLAISHETLDDFVILRSDGTPVYNLAVVSDDLEGRVTHVIRGDDHISNTPKQILIYRALGKTPPEFGHVPLILGADGKRLSKRHGAMSILAYRESGFLPAAMVNFLALLGWSPGDDREVLGLDELIETFSIERILKKSAVFDLEKLEWLNGRHIAAAPAAELAPLVLEVLEVRARERGSTLDTTHPPIRSDAARLESVIDLVKVRPRTLHALADQVSPFFARVIEYDGDAVDRFWKRPAEAAERLRALSTVLEEVETPWTPAALEEAVRGLAERVDVGAGAVINPLRVALMGQAVSPGIFELLVAMGPERTRARIESALGFLDAKAAVEQ